MSEQLPLSTTVGDLCKAALKDAGVIGVGQTPLAEDINDAWSRLQWMLQGWQHKRWLVYHNVTYLVTSTDARSYTVGPGGNINTGTSGLVARPDKIESAFLRQLTQSQPNQIDYPLRLMQSMEDYNRIALKGLVSFPGSAFYDPAWPLGLLYAWPVPEANIYAIGITVKENLPASFPSLTTVINLPYEYYLAMESNLAIMLRPKYGIGTYPGDMLPSVAKNALQALRTGAVAIAELQQPADLSRNGIYNIFSDRTY